MKDAAPDVSTPAPSGVDPLTGAMSHDAATPDVVHDRLVAFVHELGHTPRWETRDEIGAGGMGHVALVYDRWLGRDVALKTPATAADELRLLREALVTARLEHPGIVAVYDAGRGPDGVPWFGMRLVRGTSLAAMLAERRARPTTHEVGTLLRHVLAAAEAVAFAHARGVVHRDLKPSNIMVGAFGETQVIDWGLALAPDLASPDPGRAGTLSAMSPEQARGEPLDARGDVYALGAILREIACGRALFAKGVEREALLAELAADRVPAAPRDVPRELRAIIGRAMMPRRDERYPNAKALADDLARYLDGRRVLAHRYSTFELIRRLVSTWRVPLAIAAVGVIVLAITVALAFLRIRAERDVADERLAITLVDAARQALTRDLWGPAELLARAALDREPVEARGILMALPEAAPVRTPLGRLGCEPQDVVRMAGGRTRVLCRTAGAIAIWEEGRERWGMSSATLGAALVDGGELVLIQGDDKALHMLRAEDGVPVERRPAPCASMTTFEPAGSEAALGFVGNCVARMTGDRADLLPVDRCRHSPVRAAALSEVGDAWALACSDGSLVVGRFESSPGSDAERFETSFPASPHGPLATALGFEAPETLLVGDDAGQLRRVDLRAPRRALDARPALGIGRGLVRSIAVSPGGEIAVVVLDGESPSVIDLSRWSSLGRVALGRVHARPRIAFVAPRAFIVAHDEVTRWDFSDVLPRALRFAHGISAMAVSADGALLAAGSGDHLAIIDADTRRVLASHRWQSDLVKTAAFGPDRGLVAAGMGARPGVLFDPYRHVASYTNDSDLKRVALLADGSALALDRERRVVRLMPDRTQERLLESVQVELVAVSPDGHRVAVIDTSHVVRRSADLHLVGHTFASLGVDLAAVALTIDDLGEVFTAHPDGLRHFDASGAEGAPLPAPGADIIAVAAAADLVATGSKDGSVRVWQRGSDRVVAHVREHTLRADTLVIEPRGRWIASGAWDGEIHLLRRPDAIVSVTADALEARWGVRLEDVIGRAR